MDHSVKNKTLQKNPKTQLIHILGDLISTNPAGNYMFKVNNRNTRTRYEICSKLSIKTPERRQWLYC